MEDLLQKILDQLILLNHNSEKKNELKNETEENFEMLSCIGENDVPEIEAPPNQPRLIYEQNFCLQNGDSKKIVFGCEENIYLLGDAFYNYDKDLIVPMDPSSLSIRGYGTGKYQSQFYENNFSVTFPKKESIRQCLTEFHRKISLWGKDFHVLIANSKRIFEIQKDKYISTGTYFNDIEYYCVRNFDFESSFSHGLLYYPGKEKPLIVDFELIASSDLVVNDRILVKRKNGKWYFYDLYLDEYISLPPLSENRIETDGRIIFDVKKNPVIPNSGQFSYSLKVWRV